MSRDHLFDFYLATNSSPYRHWHAEIEVHYCVSGNYMVQIDGMKYEVSEGNIVIIRGGLLHSTIDTGEKFSFFAFVTGYSFLGVYFNRFARKDFLYKVIKPDESDFFTPETAAMAKHAFHDILFFITQQETPSHKSLLALQDNWIVRARLLELCTIIDEHVPYNTMSPTIRDKRFKRLQELGKAFTYIEDNYSKNITLDEISAQLHYNKNSFCRAFKDMTGSTFHNYLNSYRVDQAQFYLGDASLSVSQIGAMVGLPCDKSFSRIFRHYTGMTPSFYRKKIFLCNTEREE